MAAGRPTKYSKKFNRMAEVACAFDVLACGGMDVIKTSIAGAKKLAAKCVYVICSSENIPVYIGKTKNSQRRFDVYSYKGCHNRNLDDWLSENRDTAVVYVVLCEDISLKEIELIKVYADQLFNLSNGKESNWYRYSQKTKPWMAKPGILSPSSILLRNLLSKDKKNKTCLEIKKIRSGMDDVSRCCFEIETAMEMTPAFDKEIDKWLYFTKNKMLVFLSKFNTGLVNSCGAVQKVEL